MKWGAEDSMLVALDPLSCVRANRRIEMQKGLERRDDVEPFVEGERAQRVTNQNFVRDLWRRSTMKSPDQLSNASVD